jgi:hypothetical protein
MVSCSGDCVEQCLADTDEAYGVPNTQGKQMRGLYFYIRGIRGSCLFYNPCHVTDHVCGRNMDIIGVSGIPAEAELLAAIVLFLERVKLSSEDIVIKVSSRKVLQAILERYSVPEESVGPVSVVVDKMEKIPLEKVVPALHCQKQTSLQTFSISYF